MLPVLLSDSLLEQIDEFWCLEEEPHARWVEEIQKQVNVDAKALALLRCGEIATDIFFASLQSGKGFGKNKNLYTAIPPAVSTSYNLAFSSIYKFRDYQCGIISQINSRNTLSQFTLLRGLHELCATMSYHSQSLSSLNKNLKISSSNSNWQHMEKLLKTAHSENEKIFKGTTLSKDASLHINGSLAALRQDTSFSHSAYRHIHGIAELITDSKLIYIVEPAFKGSARVEKWSSLSWLFDEEKSIESIKENKFDIDFDAMGDFFYAFLCQMVHPNEGSNFIVGFDAVEHFLDAMRSNETLIYTCLSLRMMDMYSDLFFSIVSKILLCTSELERLGCIVGSGGDYKEFATGGNPILKSSQNYAWGVGLFSLSTLSTEVDDLAGALMYSLGEEHKKKGGSGDISHLIHDLQLISYLCRGRKVLPESLQRLS